MFNYFLSLFRQDPFDQHVSQVLTENGYSKTEIVEKFFRQTLFQQKFVFIIIKRNGHFYVLLILDELHRNKIVVSLQRNTPKSYIIKNEKFNNEIQARDYISQKIISYQRGNFDGEAYYFRIVKCKSDCRHLIARIPDADGCFLPGDYITRDLKGFKLASHAGIYCGRNKIVHYDSPDASATIWSCLCGNSNHYVHLTEWEKFVINRSQDIRILVHCFQQSLKEDKVRAAEELAVQKYGKDQYGILTNNCQHFASLISTGRLEMIDREIVVRAVETAVYIGGFAALGYVAYKLFFANPEPVVAENVVNGNPTNGNPNGDNNEQQ
jgi:hypothetical protein